MPVRIFGTDHQGRIFSENVMTADVSRKGARLTDIQAKIAPDEIIGLTYGRNRVHFRVKWLGPSGSPLQGQAGLQNLTPERALWNFPLPDTSPDTFRVESRGERRQSPRVKCEVPVELRAHGEPTMWGKATDLSLGGCFVEMPIPPKQEEFEISLWLGGIKLRLQASIASKAPGYGIGVRFLEVSLEEKELLERNLSVLAAEER